MTANMSHSEDDIQMSGSHALNALTLHYWKLLDWRFLLPVFPVTIGYGGQTDGEIVTAIRLMDPNATAIRQLSRKPSKRFEVVFLSFPDLALFESGIAAVQPGGWICLQTRRSISGSAAPRTLAGWKRALVRHGLRDVCVYWHAPNLECSSRIVPVDSPTAVRDTLSRHQSVRFGRVKAVIGIFALRLGCFASAVPEGTVIGRKPHEGEST
jgi:hypothetical protein